MRSGNKAIVVLLGLIGAGLCFAASIPAWLDDAITVWNDENPEIPIRFVDIKDEFVWYMVPENTEFGHKEIRSRIQAIALENKYMTTDEEELSRNHMHNGRVNSWEISRIAVEQEQVSADGGVYTDTHTIRIRGHLALADDGETEVEFQDLIDRIRERVRNNRLLDCAVIVPSSLQAPTIGHAMLGSVLCHFCELEFEAKTRESNT